MFGDVCEGDERRWMEKVRGRVSAQRIDEMSKERVKPSAVEALILPLLVSNIRLKV
jgi:hypothetical protein